jgi:hypothetical protein
MAISYDPPGKVAAAFHASDAFVRGLLGPVGSGKSSSCCMEIFRRALEQEPGPDKVRRSRWAAIRNTYGELKTTTIKTWEDWFKGMHVMRWDTPIVSRINLPNLGDGTSLELEVLFLALDRPDDVSKLKSLELTGAWLNEASELDAAVLDTAKERCRRFPSMREGGPTWTGIIMDTNPPDDDHWWYKLAEEEKPEGHAFFRQPGGLFEVKDKASPDFGKFLPNPDAENLSNLSGGHLYYTAQLPGKPKDRVRIMLCGQYGTTLTGKPVYPEFNETLHVSPKPLQPIRGYPLLLSFDFGLTPACIFQQMSPKGQLLVLREVTSEGVGIRQFYSEVILPLLQNEYKGFRVEGVGDPAGVNRSQTDEKTCYEELEEQGFICEPAPSNEFVKRREAVAYFLTRHTSAGPGILLDPSCKTLIKGFRGGYRYERLKVSGTARFKDRPIKDGFSHPHDGLQYGAMHLRAEQTAAPVQTTIQPVAWA